MTPSWLHLFLLGVAGNVTMEAWSVVRTYNAGRTTPARLKRWGFWIARIVLAAGAGVLAASFAHNDPTAFAYGAGAPAILEKLARNPEEA